MNAQFRPIAGLVRERLERHPHFRSRTHLLRIEETNGSVLVAGRVPTYYLKQILQESILTVPGVAHIDNRVDVAQW